MRKKKMTRGQRQALAAVAKILRDFYASEEAKGWAVDFDAMTHASAEMLGSIILARLIKVERERNAARADASTFVFMVRELPDTQPPPPVFYDVVAQLSAPKAVAAWSTITGAWPK